jgi:superfamily II DNA helicase RecQ
MSNRTTKASYSFYNRELNLGKTLTLDTLEKSLDFCLAYFNFFSIDNFSLKAPRRSITPINTSKDLGSSPITLDLVKEKNIINNSLSLKPKSLESYIKDYFNNSTTTYKDLKQIEAIETILKGNPFTTYINKTSSRKSLLFLLPSFIYKDRSYIIITPRLSLKEDLYKRTLSKNIKVSILESSLDLSSSLILISLESILSKGLEDLISSLKSYNRDITIYLDEIYLFLLERNYRKILRYISSILKFKIPLVFISATLPLDLITLIEREFNITRGHRIIRASASRPNIEYNLRYITKGNTKVKELELLLKKDIYPRTNKDNKTLIFINSEALGLEISSKLDLPFYYSKGSNKESTLKEFLEDPYQNVLLTTSILEVGVDFSSITFIIYLEPIYSLISLVQSIGRIRNKGIGYILVSKPKSFIDPLVTYFNKNSTKSLTIEQFKELDLIYSKALVVEEKCLRSIINRFLDNTITSKCNSFIETRCSLCSKRESILEESSKLENLERNSIELRVFRVRGVIGIIIHNYMQYARWQPYSGCHLAPAVNLTAILTRLAAT